MLIVEQHAFDANLIGYTKRTSYISLVITPLVPQSH